MKNCTKCKQEKEMDQFSPDKRAKDGKQPSCKACMAEASRKSHAKNPKVGHARNKLWRELNTDRERERKKEYRNANIDAVKSTQSKWMRLNLARMREHNANRRAKTKAKLSKGLILRLYALQRGLCACCGAPLGSSYHADHIIPLAKGGPHIDSNIQLLRDICNMQKKDKDPIEFMQSRGFLI